MRKIKRFITDVTFFLFWGPFRIGVKKLPVWIVFFVSGLVASFFFRFFRKDLIRIINIIGNPDSKEHARQIAEKSFEIYVKRNVENLFMGNLTQSYLEQAVSIEGLEHLTSALEKKRGVIIQLAHFGSFMTILPALGFKGYAINQLVGKPELDSPVLRWVYNAKVKENNGLPVKFLHVDRSVRPVIKALKNNELVAIAFDGREGTDWVSLPFLGRQANLSPGPVKIAKLTGSVILPTFIIRQKDDTHRMIIEKPLVLEPDTDKKNFSLRNMKKLAEIFDGYIHDYPCHFAMTINAIKRREEKNVAAMPLFIKER